jgi:hypothetical protein
MHSTCQTILMTSTTAKRKSISNFATSVILQMFCVDFENWIQFDPVDYNLITTKYQTLMLGNSNVEPPKPALPIQNSAMDQYKAVF